MDMVFPFSSLVYDVSSISGNPLVSFPTAFATFNNSGTPAYVAAWTVLETYPAGESRVFVSDSFANPTGWSSQTNPFPNASFYRYPSISCNSTGCLMVLFDDTTLRGFTATRKDLTTWSPLFSHQLNSTLIQAGGFWIGSEPAVIVPAGPLSIVLNTIFVQPGISVRPHLFSH